MVAPEEITGAETGPGEAAEVEQEGPTITLVSDVKKGEYLFMLCTGLLAYSVGPL